MIAANLEDDDLEEDDLEEEEQEPEEELPQVRRSLGGGPGAQVTSWRRSCCSDGLLSPAGGGLPSRPEELPHCARPAGR